MLVDERSRLSKMESDNHRLSLLASESSQQSDLVVEELKEELNQQKMELTTLRTELEETAAQLSRERHQREHLQTVLHDRQAEKEVETRNHLDLQASVEILQTQNTTLAAHSQELDSLRGEYTSVKRMLENATLQANELRETQIVTLDQCHELELQVDELSKSFAEVTAENTELSTQITELAASKNEFGNELDRLQQTNNSIVATRLTLEEKLNEREKQVETLQRQIVDFDEMKQAYREQQERLDKLILQRDEVTETNSAHAETIQALRQQIESQSRSLSSLSQQQDQLRAKTADYDQVRSQAAEYDQLRQDNLSLTTRVTESSDRMQRVVDERDELRSRAEEMEYRLSQLESRNKANEETIRNLRRERGAVLARSRQTTVSSSIPFSNQSLPEDTGGRLRRDEVLGMVYTQPPKRKDDLKRISGIAQVLEKKLNAFGVYTYRQIMEWDSVAVAEFSKLLSFRDRIERDDWMGQARNLYYETYGRAA